MIEALLFAAAAPLAEEDLRRRLPAEVDVPAALTAVRARYAGRGVELVCVAGRWRLQTAHDLEHLMTEERQRVFGWEIVEDAARGYRRVVPSPDPIEIVELEVIRDLVKEGVLEARQLEAFTDLYLRAKRTQGVG